MSSLLVPLDGSPLAEESLPWAGLIARNSSGSVRLLGVYGYDAQMWEAAGIDPSNEVAEARASLTRYLERMAAGSHLDGVTVGTETRAGDVAAEIVACAVEHAADMVVITTHGAGGKDRGSVADKLVRRSAIPVLVVPPGAKPEAALDGVLVPLDGSQTAHAALPVAREIGEMAGARVHLLHVVDAAIGWGTDGGEPKGLADALEQAARRDLDAVMTAEEHVEVRRGKAVDTILEYASESGCQLVVMATHGRGGQVRMDLGSTADAVLRAADRPVLVVPAR